MEIQQAFNAVRNRFMMLPPMFQAVIIFTIIYFAYKFYKDKDKRKIEKNKGKALKTDEAHYKEKGVKRSYDLTNYVSFADKLEEAMYNEGGFGTDEVAIYAVFGKMKNDVDIIELEKAFGKREYTGAWDMGYLTFDGPIPLSKWLLRELEDSERAQVNKILAKRKIKKRY